MSNTKRVLIIVAILAALAASYVAGIVTAIRVERGARQVAATVEVQPQVVFNGCTGCTTVWYDWLCWLSGC